MYMFIVRSFQLNDTWLDSFISLKQIRIRVEMQEAMEGSSGTTTSDRQFDNPLDRAAASASAAPSDGGGSYDCNICLELAQDPVVTLCGHLFCWPCLYRWLVSRSSCKECPVCKSAVEEAKVIPIYGRGKGSTDPRTKAVPGVEIPHRPAGRRTDVPRGVYEQQQNQQPFGFSVFTGPAATAQFGNVTLSAGFGLFPFLFGFSTSGFPDPGAGFPFGNGQAAGRMPAGAAAAGAGNGAHAPTSENQNQEALLSRLLIFVGCFVILCLCFF